MATTQKITEAQAGEYARSLFNWSTPLIWDIRQSPEGDEALDVELHVPGEGYGFLVVTTWLENGQPYGEW